MSESEKALLGAINEIQSLYQDACDVCDEVAYAEVKLERLKDINEKIGRICGKILPG
jgi:hypothetical protein